MKRSVSARLRGFVDSTDRSPLAAVFRTSGLAFSIPYSLLARLHHGLYDLRIRKSIQVPCPTISVGNITMGGVGKSPFVAWLTEFLVSQGRRPGLISRGYKSREQASQSPTRRFDEERAPVDEFEQYRLFNDEAREFSVRFPSIPYFLGRDRVEVARALLKSNPELDALILDDAFQHRRIARDLDVVLLDALNPFGGFRLPPSGFLREPPSALARADVLLLNRADLVDEATRDEIRTRARAYAPNALWGELAQRPRSVCRRVRSESRPDRFEIRETSLEEWRRDSNGSRVLAFCGLGAPAGFKKTLENVGIVPVATLEFPDHCVYSPNDLRTLADEAKRTNADVLLTTMKDFVKFDETKTPDIPLRALTIGVEFLAGRDDFCRKTIQTLESRPKSR